MTRFPVTKDRRTFIVAGCALALGVVLTLLAFRLAAAAGGDAVAWVNGEKVTKEAFYERLEQEAGEYVLDQLITETLIAQKDGVDGIRVEDDEIQREIDRLQEAYASEEAFADDLARYGMTLEQLEENIRLNLILAKLSRKGLSVSDEAIAEYFEDHKEALATPEQVRVSHILVETREEAEDVIAQLEDGADFEQLARSKSIDTASGLRGGDIGLIDRDSPVVEPFKDAAFDLDAGELSQPVETEFGWHVLQVKERREAKPATLESSRDLIEEILLDQQARPIGEILAELRAGAAIEVASPRYEAFANQPPTS